MSAELDCGDNSCLFATRKGGMRTNGGCRCLDGLSSSRERAARMYILNLRAQLATAAVKLEGYEDALKAVAAVRDGRVVPKPDAAVCPRCNGSKHEPGSYDSVTPCDECGGIGWVPYFGD